jgi:hypothetical protein
MKTMKRNISLFLALLTLGLTSTSCLKDTAILDPEGSKNVVEFFNVTAPTSPGASPVVTYVPMTLEVVPESEFKMMISYSGAELAAPQDINVQLAAAPEIIGTYNTAQGAALVQVSPSHIEFPASVTIPKGQKRVEVSVKVKSDQLDPSVSNAFGVKIVSASHGVVSGNFGSVIFSLPIKSVWEGVYTYNVTSTAADVGNKTVQNVRLNTVGPNRLRVNGLWQTYSGWSEYQFNATSDDITQIANFSGSNIPGTNVVVHEANPEAGIFEVSWVGLGRAVRERWVRTGD